MDDVRVRDEYVPSPLRNGAGWTKRCVLLTLVCLCPFVQAQEGTAQILFDEVTGVTGIANTGSTYGVSWGDYDGDGLPDLWVSNHGRKPSLYWNQGNSFLEIADSVWSGGPFKDTHGAVWADIDNDGDGDLLETRGAQRGIGSGPNHFFLNRSGILVDLASRAGLEYGVGRGRMGLWLDVNRDGLLDALLLNEARLDGQGPSALFLRQWFSFRNVSVPAGFDFPKTALYAQLADLTGDHRLDLVLHGRSAYPQAVLSLKTPPLVDKKSEVFVGSHFGVTDSVLADLDGDLLIDAFLVRARNRDQIALDEDGKLRARLQINGREKGFDFSATSPVGFFLEAYMPVQVGAGANSPPNSREFELSSSNPLFHGMPPFVPGVDTGVFIGFDTTAATWKVRVSSPVWVAVGAVVSSSGAITGQQEYGFPPYAQEAEDLLLLNGAGGLANASVEGGFDAPSSCWSVVAGDFDNDGDLDLYSVCSESVLNLPNRLYENLGGGVFSEVAGAGGATGSDVGLGDSVATADYDSDGFLDLFVTNGREWPALSGDGPHQLFRNRGGSNHWLQIDLQGTTSNRDGIGAIVYARAGGSLQVRGQGGGVHHISQDFKRLHFGIGSNEVVDEIRVRWPTGSWQILDNIAADQVLLIVEP